ncbi:phage major capsid protein, partial [Streptococcus pneumoniae]|uniref:phage major capsid protein n=1 Tax=Streptococcus pneumoniae TaxID=1313 RepID=UPI001E3EB250
LSSGNIDEVYQDIWEWHCGQKVEDWRGAVRIANIDVSNLVGESGAADLIKLMIKGQHRLEPVEGMGTPIIYVSRTVAQMLDIQS